jgi:hypothetical protein
MCRIPAIRFGVPLEQWEINDPGERKHIFINRSINARISVSFKNFVIGDLISASVNATVARPRAPFALAISVNSSICLRV